MKNYETLRKQYPEYISLEQLHRICRIAKRSAKYLVENGIIPATDTGRTTWRWKIALDDVIIYLSQREKRGSMIPTGAVNSRKDRNYATGTRSSFAQVVTPGQERMVVKYFEHIIADYADVLTLADIVEITGLAKNSLQKLISTGHIDTIATAPRYLVPKRYLLDFIGRKRFRDMRTSSKRFNELLAGFEVWKQNH